MPASSETVRAAILKAAGELFYEKGYSATSLAAVAADAGVEKGHVTYYFANKTALMSAVIASGLEEIHAEVNGWQADTLPVRDALDRFVSMLEGRRKNLAKFGCPMGTLTGELGKAHPELQKESRELLEFLIKWLTARFEGIVDSPSEKAEALLAMAQGASVICHLRRDPAVMLHHGTLMRRWLDALLQDRRSRPAKAR